MNTTHMQSQPSKKGKCSLLSKENILFLVAVLLSKWPSKYRLTCVVSRQYHDSRCIYKHLELGKYCFFSNFQATMSC